ncbi:MAG: hypothetical protein F4117_02785 [Acidimicrobiales bacterium]|nr:hypothetical protein [Acidimicrobiales bacterium]MYB81652.1 hypothetical protein [Acidimicrobiales bacterium]MYI11475.1 hypothetical protein [Acidimicrobiales bacterium]MYJ47243.1 hypothetical protein [Acidimicrobiales bacterium]
MDSPVTKLIFIAAAVAASVLVVTVMWTTLGSNAPSTDGNVDATKIQTKELCDAVYGTDPSSKWDNTNKACTP